VARQRLAQRGNEDVSDGRWEIHTSQESAFEPFTEKEESELIRVFTDAPLNSCTQSAVQGLLDTIRVSVASGGQH
jgi:predicted kinase